MDQLRRFEIATKLRELAGLIENPALPEDLVRACEAYFAPPHHAILQAWEHYQRAHSDKPVTREDLLHIQRELRRYAAEQGYSRPDPDDNSTS